MFSHVLHPISIVNVGLVFRQSHTKPLIIYDVLLLLSRRHLEDLKVPSLSQGKRRLYHIMEMSFLVWLAAEGQVCVCSVVRVGKRSDGDELSSVSLFLLRLDEAAHSVRKATRRARPAKPPMIAPVMGMAWLDELARFAGLIPVDGASGDPEGEISLTFWVLKGCWVRLDVEEGFE